MSVVYEVKVQTRSSKPGVEVTGEKSFRIKVRAVPEKGKANKEVLELLAAHLGVPVTRLSVKAGAGATRKLIELAG
jgi:Uncharacterized conserved protein